MKTKSIIFFFLASLFLSATFFVPLQVAAQGIDVTPLDWDFGDVELGSSVSKVFIITNPGPVPLSVYNVTIEDDATSSFSIESDVPPPTSIVYPENPSGYPTTLEVEVVFSPTSLGSHTASIFIESDAEPPNNRLYVPLNGTGVEPGTSPGDQIIDILEFYDNSIADGSLVGSGPGRSAGNRLKALKNMLLSVQDLIDSGDYEGACEQILDALKKCDGDPIPPDFVTGDAASDLFEQLQNLQVSLACI